MSDEKFDRGVLHQYDNEHLLDVHESQVKASIMAGDANLQNVKQALRRGKALKSAFVTLFEMREPFHGDATKSVICRINPSEFTDIMKDPRWVPLRNYYKRLTYVDSKGATRCHRKLLENEVGMLINEETGEGRIVVINT